MAIQLDINNEISSITLMEKKRMTGLVQDQSGISIKNNKNEDE